jgi:hypothetical protein
VSPESVLAGATPKELQTAAQDFGLLPEQVEQLLELAGGEG